MIVEYTRYRITADQHEAFERAYGKAGEALATSPHCERYELTRCTEDRSQYVLRIEWDSAEGHLEGFRKSPEFRVLLGSVQPFFNSIEEMRHYESTGVEGKGGAK